MAIDIGVCLCVCVHCYSHAENHNWTFDDYACYVFRIHAPKTIYQQGAAGNVIVLRPTKTAMTFCDIDPGRWIDVPA